MIEINNLTTISINEQFLRKVAEAVLGGEKKKGIDLSIAFVGQGRMIKINKKYRGKNRVTDVLAFPESKVLFEKFKVGPIQETKNLGEIIICPREVNKNAKKYKTTYEVELSRVLIHGILHLLGYDHVGPEKKAQKMAEKENYYLKLIFL